ncbi:MAG: pilus assembly protein [Deltaproteobacteria bacterium]|jgi:Flp pilus assembly protein TadG|nr:pilus assembly protein [Deltaproteobacteria bacterium]
MMIRKIRDSKGTIAIEFVLVIPIFLIFVFGTIDFGWYFFCDHTIELATREGARLGVVISEEYAIKEKIKDCASIAVVLDDSNISISQDPQDANVKRVLTQYTHDFLTPIIGAFFSGGSITIQAEVTYKVEPEPYVPPS